jgi:hypothetical protein
MMRVAFRRSLHMFAAVMSMLTGVAIDGSPASYNSRAADSGFRSSWRCAFQKNEVRNISPSG